MSAFAPRSGSGRQILFHVSLTLLAVAALNRLAVADPTTVEVRDSRGEPWQVVIAQAEPGELTLQAPREEDAPPRDQVRDDDAPEGEPAPLLAEPRTIRTEEHGVEIVAEASASSTYEEIYGSIPFSRAEYDANPSYRHDATMELLTGNPRPDRCCPAAAPYGPGAPPYGPYPFPAYRPYDPFFNFPYRVFPYPAFGYKSRYYPVARHVYGINYNLWHPVPGVFRSY